MRRCLNCMNEYGDQYGDKCPHCGYVDGATLTGDVCLRPGTILQGRYIVGTVRKVRDNDIVYIGWDALFDRRVQLQEYFPRYCATRSAGTRLSIYGSKQDQFQSGLRLFCTQSRELIRLYKDERVITYHACFQENLTAYAVTEYREEQTLEEWTAGRKLGEQEALAVLQEAIMAVDAAHKIGVSHGMLAPDTFWRTSEGRLILKDFGAWRYISGEPGIVNYGKAGPETDVFGLARMFCQLVTGAVLEDGDTLETDLLRNHVTLSRDVMTAVRHGLSHETRSLYQFYEALGGNRETGTARSFVRNRSKRRDAKSSLSVPGWVYGAAAAGLAAAGVIAVLILSGVVKPQFNADRNQMEAGQVRVPNLIQMEEKDAERELERLGLTMSKEKKEFSDQIGENIISYQKTKENTLVERGTEIVVWISKGKEKKVLPAVKGCQKEEALRILKEAGFTNYKVKESQEKGVYNSVLEVSEAAGDNVELDKEIILTVCVREQKQEPERKRIQVPDLSGMKRADAGKVLEEAGFQVNWIEEFSSQEEEGLVMGQKPEAGSQADQNSFVTVRVSMGPEKIYMPDMELMTLEEAGEKLEKLGLKTGTVTESYDASVPAGKIISQSIPQDQVVSRGMAVDLVVSKGKSPEKRKPAEPETKRQPRPAGNQSQTETPAVQEPQNQTEAAQGQNGSETKEGESRGSTESGGQADMSQAQTEHAVNPQETEGSGRDPEETDETKKADPRETAPVVGSSRQENQESAAGPAPGLPRNVDSQTPGTSAEVGVRPGEETAPEQQGTEAAP